MKGLAELVFSQAKWSQETFGTDAQKGPIGVIKHLAKECNELLEDPHDIKEWADVLILLLDGSRRAGFFFGEVIDAALAKMEENKKRSWPPIDPSKFDSPVEHIKKG